MRKNPFERGLYGFRGSRLAHLSKPFSLLELKLRIDAEWLYGGASADERGQTQPLELLSPVVEAYSKRVLDAW